MDYTSYFLTDDGHVPNNPALPVLVYAGAFNLAGADPAAVAEARFSDNGWGGLWRNGIYDFHHYHSTAHEALAIVRGWATVQLGGEQGIVLDITAGDVMVLPVGTGHKRLAAGADLLVVGAYPPGQRPDLCRGAPQERPAALRNIAAVPLPSTDPLYGASGPLVDLWLHNKAQA